MIGTNTIDLNEASAKEAIQHWLNTTQLKNPVEVTAIHRNTESRGGLTITVKPQEESKE